MFLCTVVLLLTMLVLSQSHFISFGFPVNRVISNYINRTSPSESTSRTKRIYSCPTKLVASWLLKPPYVTTTSISENSVEIGGIFHKVLVVALNSCCAALSGGDKIVLSYNAEAAANESLLRKAILESKADLILPVQSDRCEYKEYLPYLKILESPGIALIQRTDSKQGNSALLWNAIWGCWPIVVLTILLSFVAGMCVWAMETTENNKEFRSPYYRGVFDGFWWAFVTMSTVGYGDKTPQSITVRLFSVLWIMIGVTVSSILTATLSSALTEVTADRYDVLTGMKIGAARDSIALQKVVQLGANAAVFENLDEVYDALVSKQSVDGMLEEMFTVVEYLKQKENSLLSIVHLFQEKHGYGVAFKRDVWKTFGQDILGCVSKVISFLTKDAYAVIHSDDAWNFNEHVMHETDTKSREAQGIIDQKSPVFFGTVVGLCGVTFVFFTINMALKWCKGRRLDIPRHDVETGREKGIAVFTYGNTTRLQDGKHLEYVASELAASPFTSRTTEKNGKDDHN